MAASFYFYDLETSGVRPASSRIMQFAGQRVSLTLEPIGKPDNFLIKMTEDTLPEPDAILITGITPQATRADGITEAEFLKYFHEKIAVPGTIFVGFNNIRFDDEFIRYLNYRNFYDAYEWCWRDNRSRWDMLDVARMTRALRPDGIKWPFGTDGKASNALGLLTSINDLAHENAHDALSDVTATISFARLLRNKQTKLFDYLLSMRDKAKIRELVEENKPFVYTSGKFPSLYEKTTVVQRIGHHPGKQGVLVFDLRIDPGPFAKLSPDELVQKWSERHDDETKRFPIKTLQYNRCPAVAPFAVLDDESTERIKLDKKAVIANSKKLSSLKQLHKNLVKALELMDKKRQATLLSDEQLVDQQLYDGFFEDIDRNRMGVVRAADEDSLLGLDIEFEDDRLNRLLPLYKARNFPNAISDEDRKIWEAFRKQKLLGGKDKSLASKFFVRIGELMQQPNLTSHQSFLLQELQLYGESILPEMDGEPEE